MQDISLAAHPLDKDWAVAAAWVQAGWADYTGVSRTMSALSWAEAHEIVSVLERVSRPFLESELSVLHSQGSRLQYDGDLTGLPVSNTSKTYPNAAYGHMSDEVRLGNPSAITAIDSSQSGSRLSRVLCQVRLETIQFSSIQRLPSTLHLNSFIFLIDYSYGSVS